MEGGVVTGESVGCEGSVGEGWSYWVPLEEGGRLESGEVG